MPFQAPWITLLELSQQSNLPEKQPSRLHSQICSLNQALCRVKGDLATPHPTQTPVPQPVHQGNKTSIFIHLQAYKEVEGTSTLPPNSSENLPTATRLCTEHRPAMHGPSQIRERMEQLQTYFELLGSQLQSLSQTRKWFLLVSFA